MIRSLQAEIIDAVAEMFSHLNAAEREKMQVGLEAVFQDQNRRAAKKPVKI